jgi:hypothetical protein
MRRLIPILVAALAGSALTAAAITLPARAGDRDERFGERLRAWQDCMRGQGFDLEGATTIRIADGRVTIDGEEVDPDRFGDAREACGGPFQVPPYLEQVPEFGELPELGELPEFGELPDRELLPKLPDFVPPTLPDFEPRFPDVEPRVPDFGLRPRSDELPELQELRDRLERLENCLRGGLQEA